MRSREGLSPTPFHKMRIQCGILFRLSSALITQLKSALIHEIRSPASFTTTSREFERRAKRFSCLDDRSNRFRVPRYAGFRERRTAPFRVRAKRPTLCHRAACGRDHESRRRRAPLATNAPCGRREINPASRRATKALRPTLDIQDAQTPNAPSRS